MKTYEKTMHIGTAHLVEGCAHKREPQSKGGNPRVEQHAGQQVGVLVSFYHEEISLNVACGQNKIWGRLGGKGEEAVNPHFQPPYATILPHPVNPSEIGKVS
jgi:hypothetical protein